MDTNKENKSKNGSMFLYTALIFLVALILIIVAFFGNLKRPKTMPDPTPPPVVEDTESYKKAEQEIIKLRGITAAYETLLEANTYVDAEDYNQAEALLSPLETAELTEQQAKLYEELKEKINAGKEE